MTPCVRRAHKSSRRVGIAYVHGGFNNSTDKHTLVLK